MLDKIKNYYSSRHSLEIKQLLIQRNEVDEWQ